MKLTKREKQLLEEHGDYVKKRVRKFNFIPPLQYEEATSYVYSELCKRIKSYKTSKEFEKFLNRIIKLSVYNYYRKARHEPVKINENIASTCISVEKEYWQECKDKILKEEIEKLDSENCKIVKLYYFDNKTENEIGKVIGLARNTISVRLKKALAIIKPKIEKRLKELDEIRSEL